MEHPNAELYRRVTAAFQSGDIETVRSALAPGLRWHEAGNRRVSRFLRQVGQGFFE